MFEVSFHSELKKFVISPLGGQQKEYFIVCSSEYEAKALCFQISLNLVPSPTTDPLRYRFITEVTEGQAKVYRLKR